MTEEQIKEIDYTILAQWDTGMEWEIIYIQKKGVI